MSNIINIDTTTFLTNKHIISASLEVKGAILSLLCCANNEGNILSIENDDGLLSKIIGCELNYYESTIKPSILKVFSADNKFIYLTPNNAQKLAKIKEEKEDIALTPTTETQPLPVVVEHTQQSGVSLSKLLEYGPDLFFNQDTNKPNTLTNPTLAKQQTPKNTIWTIGVGLLSQDDYPENKVRSFLGKLIAEYGEQDVAGALASLSLKSISPADGRSYLVGILKKDTKTQKQRGSVIL